MASEEFPLWAVLHDSVSVLFPQICGVTRWGKRMYGDTSELMIATMVAVVGDWWLVQLHSSLVDIIFFLCQFVSRPL